MPVGRRNMSDKMVLVASHAIVVVSLYPITLSSSDQVVRDKFARIDQDPAASSMDMLSMSKKHDRRVKVAGWVLPEGCLSICLSMLGDQLGVA